MVNLVDGQIFSGTAYVHGKASGNVVASDLELSFWGGVDPWTGEVIDRHHPLSGHCLKDHILAIPGGRGSCSGSGVMLELLLNGKGPKAMLFEREEDILTLGVVIAEEVFGQSIPVVTLTPENFRKVVSSAFVAIDGNVVSCSADGLAMDAIPAHSETLAIFSAKSNCRSGIELIWLVTMGRLRNRRSA